MRFRGINIVDRSLHQPSAGARTTVGVIPNQEIVEAQFVLSLLMGAARSARPVNLIKPKLVARAVSVLNQLCD
jgi:hypothetical protein